MLIRFEHYADIEPLEIPDQNLVGIYSPTEVKLEKSEKQIIQEAFQNPIGTPPIHQMVKPDDKVLILVDDITRTTPTDIILPELMNELVNVKKENITLMVALGTHRPMTNEEKIKKYGKEIVENYKIVDHHWQDTDSLVETGTTPNGTKIIINKAILEADFTIGIGHIVPHVVAGYGGGGKIVQPGICGAETTGQTHWLSAKYEGCDIMGKADNSVRLEMEEVARESGLKVIINAVQDGKGRLVGVFVGDLVAAHRKGVELAQQVYGVKIPQLFDIVVYDSYPADIELWQAAKGIYSADLAVRKGGVIILVSPCPEGVSRVHKTILEEGYGTFEEVQDKVNKGKIKDLTVAAHLVHVGRVIKQKPCIMVSPGIPKADKEKVGIIHADTPSQALEQAFKMVGPDAKIGVFQHGGEIMPVLEKKYYK